MGSETPAGWKLSHSSFWLDSLLTDKSRRDTSWYTGITEGLSKDGGMGGVVTEQSMKFSRDSMNLSGAFQSNLPSTQFTLGASSILQMCPLKVFPHLNPFSFHQYGSQQNSTISSSTHKLPSLLPNCERIERSVMLGKPKDSTQMLTRGLTIALNNALDVSKKCLTKRSHNASSKFDQLLSVGI